MNLAVFIPFILGMVGILQGAFYRRISDSIGLTHAVLIGNNFAMLLTIPIVYLIYKNPGWVPEFFHFKSPLPQLKWWYLVPGFFGILIVFGLPLAISKVGAVKSTVMIIVAQIMTSVIWDLLFEKIPLQSTKVIGMILALVSAFLMLSK